MESIVLEPQVERVLFEEEPLISFIVPIYDLKPDLLKRCLLSLDDQDYENIEVICVLDGPNKELERVCLKFVDAQKFKLIEIEHGGACAARNAGFNISKGHIVSFFNSDYIAKPGMARMWVDALKNNPDCGFAYGAYEYNTQQRMWYGSKPFDTFQLDVANYIDCGFPLWRKYVVDWDVNCKSLQDWDFWLRVVKTHKVKGHYLGRDISFVAAPPRPKGLSDDSHNNWINRVGYVKEKNGIEKRDIIVTSLGAPNHGVEIAKMIGADFRDDTIRKPSEYKALYMIGFFMRPDAIHNEHPEILSHYKDMGCKIIVHFIGADIYWLRKFSHESLKFLSGALKKTADHILCENVNAQKELADMGLPSEVVPIPPYNDYEVKPLPKDFSVSIFLTDKSDFDKYFGEHTLSIVRAMPDIQFNSYGDGGKDVRYPNLKHVGNLSKEEWKEFVYSNSSILRLVRHDTTPLASNEFMLAGRDAISNIPSECTDYIETKGKEDMNEWDLFAPGFNAYNWPATKTKIVQLIRQIRKRVIPDETRVSLHDALVKRFDRLTYIKTIKEMCGL